MQYFFQAIHFELKLVHDSRPCIDVLSMLFFFLFKQHLFCYIHFFPRWKDICDSHHGSSIITHCSNYLSKCDNTALIKNEIIIIYQAYLKSCSIPRIYVANAIAFLTEQYDIIAQHLSLVLIFFSSPSQNEQKVPISSLIKEIGICRYLYTIYFAQSCRN